MYEALDKETCIITSKWDGNYSNYPPEYDQVLLGTLSENMASLETYRNTPLEFSETEDEDIVNQAEDTMSILSKFIDAQSLSVNDPNKLKTLMRELYVEALSTENI